MYNLKTRIPLPGVSNPEPDQIWNCRNFDHCHRSQTGNKHMLQYMCAPACIEYACQFQDINHLEAGLLSTVAHAEIEHVADDPKILAFCKEIAECARDKVTKIFYIQGPKDSGKSHIAAAAFINIGEWFLRKAKLPRKMFRYQAQWFDGSDLENDILKMHATMYKPAKDPSVSPVYIPPNMTRYMAWLENMLSLAVVVVDGVEVFGPKTSSFIGELLSKKRPAGCFITAETVKHRSGPIVITSRLPWKLALFDLCNNISTECTGLSKLDETSVLVLDKVVTEITGSRTWTKKTRKKVFVDYCRENGLAPRISDLIELPDGTVVYEAMDPELLRKANIDNRNRAKLAEEINAGRLDVSALVNHTVITKEDIEKYEKKHGRIDADVDVNLGGGDAYSESYEDDDGVVGNVVDAAEIEDIGGFENEIVDATEIEDL